MWLLRLRSQITLENYLEVSALAKRPEAARASIKLFAATFSSLAAGDC